MRNCLLNHRATTYIHRNNGKAYKQHDWLKVWRFYPRKDPERFILVPRDKFFGSASTVCTKADLICWLLSHFIRQFFDNSLPLGISHLSGHFANWNCIWWWDWAPSTVRNKMYPWNIERSEWKDRLRNMIFDSWISYRGASKIILVSVQNYRERHPNIILFKYNWIATEYFYENKSIRLFDASTLILSEKPPYLENYK